MQHCISPRSSAKSEQHWLQMGRDSGWSRLSRVIDADGRVGRNERERCEAKREIARFRSNLAEEGGRTGLHTRASAGIEQGRLASVLNVTKLSNEPRALALSYPSARSSNYCTTNCIEHLSLHPRIFQENFSISLAHSDPKRRRRTVP